MKKVLFFIVLAIVSASCNTYFYQVYKTTYSDQINLVDNDLFYEDQNIKISYNLWSENGNIGFTLYNKTDANIYLDLGESFFILNGAANDYFRNRTVTESSSASKNAAVIPYSHYLLSSFAVTSSRGYSVSFKEERIVCIPSRTGKSFNEYIINDVVLRYCDLFLYPTKKEIKTKSFTQNDSPLVFSNRITYSCGVDSVPIMVNTEFFVSEITNYPQSEMEYRAYTEFCGKKSSLKTTFLQNVSPDKFYVKYNQILDTGSDH